MVIPEGVRHLIRIGVWNEVQEILKESSAGIPDRKEWLDLAVGLQAVMHDVRTCASLFDRRLT